MNEAHERFKEIFFNELNTLNQSDKIKFLEELLFYFTITARGIWSDEKQADTEKVEAFIWMNELTHRIWNLHFELQKEKVNDFVKSLYENMKFYSGQSKFLQMHMVPTVLKAFENFNKNKKITLSYFLVNVSQSHVTTIRNRSVINFMISKQRKIQCPGCLPLPDSQAPGLRASAISYISISLLLHSSFFILLP